MTDFEELYKSTLIDPSGCKCGFYYCTTCGGQYAKVRKALSSEDQSSLLEYLMSLSFSDFRDYGYMASRRMFVQHLLLSAKILTTDQVSDILAKWESNQNAEQTLAYSDFILFYFVRYLPKNHLVYREWVEKCRKFVTETNDYSLLESLVIVEGKGLPESIKKQAIDVATYDEQMRRAFANAFGHKEANRLFSNC